MRLKGHFALSSYELWLGTTANLCCDSSRAQSLKEPVRLRSWLLNISGQWLLNVRYRALILSMSRSMSSIARSIGPIVFKCSDAPDNRNEEGRGPAEQYHAVGTLNRAQDSPALCQRNVSITDGRVGGCRKIKRVFEALNAFFL